MELLFILIFQLILLEFQQFNFNSIYFLSIKQEDLNTLNMIHLILK